MLNAGIPISEGVKTYKAGPFLAIGLKWSDQMKVKGRPLSSIMLTSNLFKSYEIGIIKIGEKTGQMVEVLKGLDEWYDHHLSSRRKLIVRILYPLFVLFLLPILMNIPSLFEKATAMDYFTSVILFYTPYIIVAFIVGFVIPKLMISKTAFGHLLEDLVFRIPILGKYIRDGYIKKLMFANGLALKSGLGVHESLSLTLSVTQSPRFYRDIETAIQLSKTGVSYYDLISNFKWLDDVSKTMIATSERTGSVSDGMEQIYRIKTAENEARSMLLIIIFGSGILLYALGMVGYHVILAVMKYVDLVEGYSKMP